MQGICRGLGVAHHCTGLPDQRHTRQQQQGNEAWLSWVMIFAHPRIAGGRPVRVEGATRLQFDAWGKVCLHRDYFDLGAMLYEQLPLLGPVVRAIKGRLGT